MTHTDDSSSRPDRCILVVDDDEFINRSLVRSFARHGCQAVSAYNGREALRQLDQAKFDGVLLDLKMPVEDGFAVLAKRPTTRNATTPIYVLTNVGQEEDIARARQLGVTDVFVKSETSPGRVVKFVCSAARGK